MPDVPQTPCLGLIGGVGVGATVHYYGELARAFAARGIALQLVMAHADMRRVFEFFESRNAAGLAEYLAGLIARMKAAGAEIAAIPAVAPHVAIGELTAISPLPVVNLLAAVADEVRSRGLRRVSIFGTRLAMESGLFGTLEWIEVVKPRPHEIDYIHNAYFDLASGGKGSEEHYKGLTNLAQELCRRESVEAILLAGTDLSLIFDETNIDFPHLDCAGVHLRAIESALGAEPKAPAYGRRGG